MRQGNAAPELRARAMIAVGALRDPTLLPKLSELLAPGGEARADESDPISVAAAWGIARMRSPKARELMVRLLESEAPSIRALAAIGIGLLKDKRAKVQLAAVARAPDAGPLPRAAAAFALGELGDQSALESLTQLTDHGDPSVRAAAVIALARLSARDAERAVADALVSPEPQLVTAATAAALVSATGAYRGRLHALDVPDGRVDVRTVIDTLIPSGYTADEQARAVELLAPALARASVAAVQSSPERARFVADALLARDGKPSFGPLTRELEKASPQARAKAERAAESIAAAVVSPFVALATHPSPEVRALSVQFLATRSEPAAGEQLVLALEDRDERVQRAALTALKGGRSQHAIEAVTRLLGGRGDWPVRLRAAQALGELAQGITRYQSGFGAVARGSRRQLRTGSRGVGRGPGQGGSRRSPGRARAGHQGRPRAASTQNCADRVRSEAVKASCSSRRSARGFCSAAETSNASIPSPGPPTAGPMVKFAHNGFVSGEPNLEMQLELDIDSLTVQPGVITTFDRNSDLCASAAALFERTSAVRASPASSHPGGDDRPAQPARVRRRARIQLLRLGRLELPGYGGRRRVLDEERRRSKFVCSSPSRRRGPERRKPINRIHPVPTQSRARPLPRTRT